MELLIEWRLWTLTKILLTIQKHYFHGLYQLITLKQLLLSQFKSYKRMVTTLQFLIVFLFQLTRPVQYLFSNYSQLPIIWFKVISFRVEFKQQMFEEQVSSRLWIQMDKLLRIYLIRWIHLLKLLEQQILKLCLTIFHWLILQQVETTLQFWVINLKFYLLEVG